MILEISRDYVRDFYGGNLQKCLQERDGVDWMPERIKAAFNGGNGTQKDLERYMEDNKKYAYFVMI